MSPLSKGVCQLLHSETTAMIRQHSTNELMILWVFIFFSCLFEMVEPLPVINTDALLIFPPGCGTEGTRRTYGTNTSGILGILWVCFSSGVAACSETQRLLSLLHHTGPPGEQGLRGDRGVKGEKVRLLLSSCDLLYFSHFIVNKWKLVFGFTTQIHLTSSHKRQQVTQPPKGHLMHIFPCLRLRHFLMVKAEI